MITRARLVRLVSVEHKILYMPIHMGQKHARIPIARIQVDTPRFRLVLGLDKQVSETNRDGERNRLWYCRIDSVDVEKNLGESNAKIETHVVEIVRAQKMRNKVVDGFVNENARFDL